MSKFSRRGANLFELPGRDHLSRRQIRLDHCQKAAVERARTTMADEWGPMPDYRLEHKARWMDLPSLSGIGSGRPDRRAAGSTVVGEHLSIKVYQVLPSAVEMRPGRKESFLSDNGISAMLYMADGLLQEPGAGLEAQWSIRKRVADNNSPEDVLQAVMLTQVRTIRTGRVHTMEAITTRRNAAGAIMIWDLAHSAGAMPD